MLTKIKVKIFHSIHLTMFVLTHFLFVLFLITMVLIYHYTHWTRKGVPQYKYWQIWKKNIIDFIKQRPLTDEMVQLCKDFSDARYLGTYQLFSPRLCVKDPELIKQILVKDFDHFADHSTFIPVHGDPILEKNLFIVKGEQWKHIRNIASPTFSSTKLKTMFETIVKSTQIYIRALESRKEEIITMEVKDLFGRLTSDSFFATHFGIFNNSLDEPNNECYVLGKLGIDFEGIWFKFKFVLLMLCPAITKIFGLKLIDQRATAFFRRLVRTNKEMRQQHNIVRPDLINTLMKNKEKDVIKLKLTEDEEVSIALTFFGGGFDTVSTLLAFLMYELALNPDVQQHLQNEIDNAEDNLTYQSITDMKYLDMVILETLRRWPVGFFMDRCCVKPYTIPPVIPGEVEVTVNKGDQIWIPLFGIHRDEKWYSNPNEFDPERFSDENKHNINLFTYMPFGMGPRHCIGNRYASLLIKVVVYSVLSKYNIKAVKETSVPITLTRSYLQLISKNNFWLGFQKRDL